MTVLNRFKSLLHKVNFLDRFAWHFLLALLLGATNNSAAQTSLIVPTAQNATKFHDFVGINTILTNNDYGFLPESSIFETIVLPRVSELGVKWIRDSDAWGSATLSRHSAKLAQLRARGVSFYLSVLPPRVSMSDADAIEEIAKLACLKNGCVRNGYTIPPNDGIKGLILPNEIDHVASFLTHCESTGLAIPTGTWKAKVDFCYPGWENKIVAFSQSIHTHLNANPSLTNLKIVAPPLVNVLNYESIPVGIENSLWDVLKPISLFTDFGSGNLYTWRKTHHHGALQTEIPTRHEFFSSDTRSQKIVVTEMGYYTSPMGTPDPDVSHPKVHSKNMIRSLFEYFNHPSVERTFIFELLDRPSALSARERSFGLLYPDGTPKDVFHTVKNTLNLLSDSGIANLHEDAPIIIDDSSSTIQTSLFKKSDGSFWIAIWNDPNTSSSHLFDLSQSATITLPKIANVRIFRPSTGIAALQSFQDVLTLDLSVPDDVLLIEVISKTLRPPTNPEPEPTAQPSPTPSNPNGQCKIELRTQDGSSFSGSLKNTTRRSSYYIQLEMKKLNSWKKVWRKKLKSSKQKFIFKLSRSATKRNKYRLTSPSCRTTELSNVIRKK